MSDDDIAAVRAEVGDSPSDAVIEDTFERVGTIGGTIYEILSRRLANLISNPAQFAVSGEYSQSTAANIAALREQLKRWQAFAPVAGDALSVMHLESPHSRGFAPPPGGFFDVER